MAEVTKRKIASIYSLIAGFFLSLFGSHAHAGSLAYQKPNAKVEAGKTGGQLVSPAGILSAPAPKNGILLAPAPSTGILSAPAPTNTAPANAGQLVAPASEAGILLSPAPADALKGEVQDATQIEDQGMQTFVIEKAVEQGKNPNQLSSSDLNNLRTEYLLQQIQLLQNKVDQIHQ